MSKKSLRTLYNRPLLTEMVDTVCRGCDACTKYSPSKPEEPFVTIEEDDIFQLNPMENISADIFYVENKKPQHCVVDKFSGYIMWKPMADKTTDHVVKALMEVFATHRYCKKIKTEAEETNFSLQG